MKQVIELRPNRDLLDDDFNGYKLSLDPIPIYEKNLDCHVDQVFPTDHQFSYAHVRIFSFHNHLHFNPHTPQLLYFVDTRWNVMQVTVGFMNRVESISRVCEIPRRRERKPGDYPVTIHFASADRAVIGDGAGTFHVAAVKKDAWVIIFTDTTLPEGCLLLAATQFDNRLMILGRSVLEPKFDSLLHLLILDEIWQTVANKRIQVFGNIQFASLESAKSILLIGDGKKMPKILSDVSEEIRPEEPPKYKWTQTAEDITIEIPVSEGESSVEFLEGHITVKIGDVVIIDGKYSAAVSDVHWFNVDKKLEIHAKKAEVGVGWRQAIDGDDSGEQYQAENFDDENPPFNTEELEEVDVVSPAVLLRIDVDCCEVTHEIDLSTQQFLFSLKTEVNKPPAVCIRQLTDACVWQFESCENSWKQTHFGTFSAFGYVQASKTQRKFFAAPENLSYVAISDAFRHLYIFRQPLPVNGTLRNRTSGTRVNAVARQQLVNLETNDEILGTYATNSLLFVLTKNTFFVLVINDTVQ